MSDAYSPVPALNLLNEFDQQSGSEYYSHGFETTTFGEHGIVATWSKEQEFLDSFLCFAYANHSGSVYALWRIDEREDLGTLPVVVFGDEGGIGVVARNLVDLFRQLGCDWWQWPGWDGAQFVKRDDPGDEPSPRHEEYLAWLRGNFGLTPPDDPNDLLAEAEEEFGPRFETWLERFAPDE
ncbi:hypothetical protein ACFPZ0_21340 [Streptomonospora nanhaiensis]|uniref:SMI1/KNR4 family protein n=1 Tax=Streptomonospora nanhaiensis TaxID=1323731 RepID=A0A853BRT9_9ACTN|nr:hypothetical protein [Streptomonospora nanhaiensis]MBV2364326.1 hypothetical protein [Streptomonospora nanhaiensis]MBX9390581.1 hypothetical protein [Streptomonospora nanhaiensis]NYI97211.1 hypothetical protein [Streptomonospora nanhaiensis]